MGYVTCSWSKSLFRLLSVLGAKFTALNTDFTLCDFIVLEDGSTALMYAIRLWHIEEEGITLYLKSLNTKELPVVVSLWINITFPSLTSCMIEKTKIK